MIYKIIKENILEYRNVYIDVGNFHLKNINFFLKKGEMIALTGPSGSGKSTIINNIFNKNLYKLIEGNIFIENENYQNLTESDLFSSIYILKQDTSKNLNYLNTPNTIFEEVRQIRKKPEKQWKELISSLIKVFQLSEEILFTNLFFLSGGQKQRINIIKSILINPKILVLDESFSALDNKTKKQILSFILDWKEQSQISIIMISHDIQEILECDRTIFLEHGVIKCISDKKNVLDDLKNLYSNDTIEYFLG